MGINIEHIQTTYVPKLWWMTLDGRQMGVAEWQDEREDGETFNPDYEAELANNNYEDQ